MVQLLKFIFSGIYNSYKNSSGAKAERVNFASALVGFLLAFNVVSIFCIPLILLDSKSLLTVFIFSGAVTGLTVVGYLRTGGRHTRVLNEAEDYTVENKKKLKRNSIIYVIISVTLFVWVWYHTLPF
jgi:hypothetical protein